MRVHSMEKSQKFTASDSDSNKHAWWIWRLSLSLPKEYICFHFRKHTPKSLNTELRTLLRANTTIWIRKFTSCYCISSRLARLYELLLHNFPSDLFAYGIGEPTCGSRTYGSWSFPNLGSRILGFYRTWFANRCEPGSRTSRILINIFGVQCRRSMRSCASDADVPKYSRQKNEACVALVFNPSRRFHNVFSFAAKSVITCTCFQFKQCRR